MLEVFDSMVSGSEETGWGGRLWIVLELAIGTGQLDSLVLAIPDVGGISVVGYGAIVS